MNCPLSVVRFLFFNLSTIRGAYQHLKEFGFSMSKNTSVLNSSYRYIILVCFFRLNETAYQTSPIRSLIRYALTVIGVIQATILVAFFP